MYLSLSPHKINYTPFYGTSKEDQAPILLRASSNPTFVAKKFTKTNENETPEPVTIFKVPATSPPPIIATTNQEMTTQQQTNENNFQDIDMDVSAGSEFPLPEDRNGEFINSDELSRKQRAVNLAKRKRVSTPPSDEFPPLRIINNFAPLRNLNEITVPEQPQITASPRPRIQKPAMPKSGTPPPIILHGKPEKHQELTQLLVEVAKSGHMLKYSRNRTTITTKHADERKLLISRLESICAERTRLGTRHRRTRENRTAPERDLSDEKHRQENVLGYIF